MLESARRALEVQPSADAEPAPRIDNPAVLADAGANVATTIEDATGNVSCESTEFTKCPQRHKRPRKRASSIETLEAADEATARQLVRAFESVLGQTGATKALHLLAPRFLLLWDVAIAAQAYGLYRRDDIDYWQLTRSTSQQAVGFGGGAALGRNALKAIDEYNCCRTLGKVPPGVSEGSQVSRPQPGDLATRPARSSVKARLDSSCPTTTSFRGHDRGRSRRGHPCARERGTAPRVARSGPVLWSATVRPGPAVASRFRPTERQTGSSRGSVDGAGRPGKSRAIPVGIAARHRVGCRPVLPTRVGVGEVCVLARACHMGGCPAVQEPLRPVPAGSGKPATAGDRQVDGVRRPVADAYGRPVGPGRRCRIAGDIPMAAGGPDGLCRGQPYRGPDLFSGGRHELRPANNGSRRQAGSRSVYCGSPPLHA